MAAIITDSVLGVTVGITTTSGEALKGAVVNVSAADGAVVAEAVVGDYVKAGVGSVVGAAVLGVWMREQPVISETDRNDVRG